MKIEGTEVVGEGALFPEALIIVRLRLMRLWPDGIVYDDCPMSGPWKLNELTDLWALPCTLFVYRSEEAALQPEYPVEMLQVLATHTSITLVVQQDVDEKAAQEIIQALRDNLLLV